MRKTNHSYRSNKTNKIKKGQFYAEALDEEMHDQEEYDQEDQ